VDGSSCHASIKFKELHVEINVEPPSFISFSNSQHGFSPHKAQVQLSLPDRGCEDSRFMDVAFSYDIRDTHNVAAHGEVALPAAFRLLYAYMKLVNMCRA
jgi:hypothetical protein